MTEQGGGGGRFAEKTITEIIITEAMAISKDERTWIENVVSALETRKKKNRV